MEMGSPRADGKLRSTQASLQNICVGKGLHPAAGSQAWAEANPFIRGRVERIRRDPILIKVYEVASGSGNRVAFPVRRSQTSAELY